MMPHMPQMPSRQSESNATGVAARGELLVEDVEHLQERHVLRDTQKLVGHQARLGVRAGLAHDFEGDLHL
nr:hypothetical protein DA06_28530 [Georgenia sp. SUBG003]